MSRSQLNILTPDDLAAVVGETQGYDEPESPAIVPGWLFREFKEVYEYDVDEQPHAMMLSPVEEALGDCSFTSGGQKLIMIGVPRGTYKTTLFTQGVPVAILTRNPNARSLIDSYRHDVSKRRLAAGRRIFEMGRDGKALRPKWVDKYGDDWAPQFKELTWSDDGIVVTKRTDHSLIDPSIGTAGVDRSMVGGHFDYICADDLVNDRNSRHADERQKIYDHILDLLPILSPHGVLVIIFTRWHTDDAYGKIIREDDKRIREGRAPQWHKIIYSAYNADGSLFFPRVLTHDALNTIHERIRSRKFAAQYLLKPISDEDKTFNMDIARLVTSRFEPLARGGIVHVPAWSNERRAVETTGAWDPAGRKWNRRSDFHGMTIVGCDPLDVWWLREAVAMKGKPTDILAKWCDLIQYYRLTTLSIEDVNQQGTWIDALARELQIRGIEPPAFHEYHPSNVSKATRIELLQPKWERGEIILLPTMTDLLQQFDDFTPASEMEHEDIIDSLVQHLEIARPANPDFIRQDKNPVDPAWRERQTRLAAENEHQESSAGRTGSGWDTEGSTWSSL